MGTKIVCPNCGTSFKLPEHESVCIGKTIGKDSNMGTIYLTPEEYEKERKPYTDKCEYFGKMLAQSYGSERVQEASDEAIKELVKWESTHKVKENKPMTKQEQMIELLKANGFDTNDFFSAMGVRPVENEEIKDDEIAKRIMEDGDVFNGKLDGRWIMAQMFHMLNYKSNYGYGAGYNDALNNKGYMYQWDMLLGRNHGRETGELDRLMRRERDGEDLSIKSIWFNGFLIHEMIIDYVKKLTLYIDSMPTYKLKNVLPYKRLGKKYEKLTGKPKGDVFVDDLPKVYGKYRNLAFKAKRANTYKELCDIVREFRSIMVTPTYIAEKKYFSLSQEFKDAYKGNGAYYTANNLIRFHGCRVGASGTKEESLAELNEKANEKCGWKMLGFLKELIEYNDFDFYSAIR